MKIRFGILNENVIFSQQWTLRYHKRVGKKKEKKILKSLLLFHLSFSESQKNQKENYVSLWTILTSLLQL